MASVRYVSLTMRSQLLSAVPSWLEATSVYLPMWCSLAVRRIRVLILRES